MNYITKCVIGLSFLGTMQARNLGIYCDISYFGYLCSFLLVKYNTQIQYYICPQKYTKGHAYADELIAYGLSAIHAGIVSIGSLLYINNIYTFMGENILEAVYKFSIGYFMADIIYIVSTLENKNTSKDKSNNNTENKPEDTYMAITKKNIKNNLQNILLLIHHIAVIYYELFALDTTNPLHMIARYYFSRAMLAELAVIPLNYGWYLINTKQNNSFKFKITGLFTIGTYFFSRIVNLTNIYYSLYNEGYASYIIYCFPLLIMNYYWFGKLVMKAIK